MNHVFTSRCRLMRGAALLMFALAFAGCSRSPEAKKARYLDAGKRWMEKKDYTRAALEFRNAVQVAPRQAEPYYQLAMAYVRLGNTRGAVASLHKALELDPKHSKAQLALAELMVGSDDQALLEDARKRLTRLLGGGSAEAEAFNALAFTELKLGKVEDAIQHLEESLARFPKNLTSSVTLAKAMLARNDSRKAEEVLQKACGIDPKSPEPPIALGRFYNAQGRSAEAEQQFRKALTIDPNNGAAWMDLAMTQREMGRSQEAEQSFRRVAALPDKTYRPVHAMFLLETGRKEEAVREFESLAKQDPGDRAARSRLVAVYRSLNRTADAQKVLNDALKKNAKDLDALLERAELALGSGNYGQAQNDVNQVLHFRPDSASAHYVMAKIHDARGAEFSRRQELSEALRLNGHLLPVRLELSRVLIAQKGANAALDILNAAPSYQKKSPAFQIERNWALLATNDLAEAQKGIEALLPSGAPEVLLQNASLKIAQRKFGEARAALETTLKRNPNEVRALDTLARLDAVEKKTPAGLQRLRQYASEHPQSAPAQQLLGTWLLNTGSPAEARAAFSAAKAADPKMLDADLMLARLDIAEGHVDAARQRLKTLLAANQENPQLWLHMGWLEENAKNPAGAVQQYKKVLEKDAGNVIALNNLAYVLANDANQPDEALRYAQQVKELDPENSDVEDTLGWAFYRKGLYNGALTHLEEAVKRNSNPSAQYHLAMTYLKLGNLKRGREVLNTVRKLAPDAPEAKSAQELLAQVSKGQR